MTTTEKTAALLSAASDYELFERAFLAALATEAEESARADLTLAAARLQELSAACYGPSNYEEN